MKNQPQLFALLLILALVTTPPIAGSQTIEQLYQQWIELYNVGKYAEAEGIWRKAIQLNPKNDAAYINLGLTLSAQGKLNEAIAVYQTAIQLNPKDAYPYYNLGIALYVQGNLNEAITAFQKAIQLNPKDAYPYNGLGYLRFKQGKFDEAISLYETAIALDPNFALPRNNLEEAKRQLALLRIPTAITENIPSIEKEPLVPFMRAVVRVLPSFPDKGLPNNGTGWVIKREGNTAWIVTCRHVLFDEGLKRLSTNIEIEFYSQQEIRLRKPAKVVHITPNDDALDIAILEVQDTPKDIKPLSTSTSVFTGQNIRIIGHPLNKVPWNAVEGKISSTIKDLILDATLAEGNSGSPVLDLQNNQVVGTAIKILNTQNARSTNRLGFGSAYPMAAINQQLQAWGFKF